MAVRLGSASATLGRDRVIQRSPCQAARCWSLAAGARWCITGRGVGLLHPQAATSNRGPNSCGKMFGGGFFGGGGGDGGFFTGGVPGRFDHQYQCFPVSFIGREDLEKGNKIILPQSALDHLARLNISYPMLFEVSNTATHSKSHCGVQEFIAEEGTCYLPYWMMCNLLLTEGDLIRVTNTSLPKGNFVKLQPVSSDFLDIHNPRAVLENSLRNFATLTVGDCICINYNQKKYEIEIVECKPANAISIIEADVNVDFAQPKDYKEKELEKQAAAAVPAAGKFKQAEEPEEAIEPEAPGFKAFTGSGQRVDGKAIKISAASPTLGPAAPPPDPYANMPWMKRIPRGVKWVNSPYHYGAAHLTGAKVQDANSIVPKDKLFDGSGKQLQ